MKRATREKVAWLVTTVAPIGIIAGLTLGWPVAAFVLDGFWGGVRALGFLALSCLAGFVFLVTGVVASNAVVRWAKRGEP